jgi:hypothetical protein
MMLIMTSWRDTATQQSQDDLDGLLNVTLSFAQEMLAKRGEMYPFAAAVGIDGETRLLADDPGLGEHPDAGAVRASLLDALRRTREELRAIAVCSDVRLPDSDAIRVELEHRDGQAMSVLLPYKKKRFARGVEYRDLRAGTAEKQLWP